MILIFGGSYQGKLDFALRKFSLTEADVTRCSQDMKELDFSRKIIYGVEKFTYGCCSRGEDAEGYFKAALDRLEDHIIICDDISCGLVPMDKTERLWRETNGRCMNIVSSRSEQVYRVFCGIESRVK